MFYAEATLLSISLWPGGHHFLYADFDVGPMLGTMGPPSSYRHSKIRLAFMPVHDWEWRTVTAISIGFCWGFGFGHSFPCSKCTTSTGGRIGSVSPQFSGQNLRGLGTKITPHVNISQLWHYMCIYSGLSLVILGYLPNDLKFCFPDLSRYRWKRNFYEQLYLENKLVRFI